jgi:hypothetical protein
LFTDATVLAASSRQSIRIKQTVVVRFLLDETFGAAGLVFL